MPFLKLTHSGEYMDIALFGLPLGRLLLWATVFAVIHRLLCVGLSLWAFFTGLGGHGPAGQSIARVHEALDFPVLLLLGKPQGYLEPFGVPQIIWSGIFGLVAGASLLTFCVRRIIQPSNQAMQRPASRSDA
jgi:hypothetical protein